MYDLRASMASNESTMNDDELWRRLSKQKSIIDVHGTLTHRDEFMKYGRTHFAERKRDRENGGFAYTWFVDREKLVQSVTMTKDSPWKHLVGLFKRKRTKR